MDSLLTHFMLLSLINNQINLIMILNITTTLLSIPYYIIIIKSHVTLV